MYSITAMTKTVLVVEDYADTRTMMKFLLQRYGFEVVEAADGKEAVEKVKEVRPDLILMEINLPDMNGKDVAACIHDLPQLENVPIVAIASDDTAELRKQCLEEGFDAYLTKPVSVGNLLRVVQNLVGLQGQRIA